jgi:hypothetical protein
MFIRLLTKKLRQVIPPLYATEYQEDPTVVCKFFSNCSRWTWYVLEFDGKDTFFGLVDGFEVELGYFSLSELEDVQGPLGIPAIERDLYFEPCKLSQVRKLCHVA